MVERIKQSGMSLLVVVHLVAISGVAFQAGAITHRVGTLEAQSARTVQVIERLTDLAARMDQRVAHLEDRLPSRTAYVDPDPPHES